MYSVPLKIDADEQCFRTMARRCLAMNLAPSDIGFTDEGQATLFATLPAADDGEAFTVPRSFAELLRDAICHSAVDRFALLYDVLWRVHHGERELAENLADPAVARLHGYAHNVRRDIHKMHAFLRFREQIVDGRPSIYELVRTKAFHSSPRGSLLCRSFRRHGLGYRDPDRHRGLGSGHPRLWPAGCKARRRDRRDIG